MLANMSPRTFYKLRLVQLFSFILLLLCFGFTAASQDVKVTGTVTNKNGSLPLPGVTVTIPGSKVKATFTDENGKYSIRVSSAGSLVFSNVGFETLIVPVAGKSVVNVQMAQVAQELEDVVVVGYGFAKKSDITGNVAQIKTKTINESGFSNFQQAIAGKAAGVVVNEVSGQPGAGASIEIRGTSSINFSSQPLYVVDGIPLENPNTASLNSNPNAIGTFTSSPLTAINPNDIASIEILKDASATAIYGSRGSNGVVLITTKTGQSGKAKVSFNFSQGYSKMLKYMQMLSKEQYVQTATEGYYYRNPVAPTGGYIPPYLSSEIDNLSEYDHQKAITQVGQTRDANINVSGGDSRSKYYLSGQYFDQTGILQSSALKRYNFKINYENNLSARLKFSTNVNITKTNSRGSVINSNSGGMLNSALIYAPTVPFINPDGSYNQVRNYFYGDTYVNDPSLGIIYYNSRFPYATVTGNMQFGSFNNPKAYIDGVTNDNSILQILGNLTMSYKITDHLRLEGVFGTTVYNSLLEYYLPTYVPLSTSLRGVATLGNLQSNKVLYQTTLNYSKLINKHSVNGVIGGTVEEYLEKSQNTSSQSFTTNITGVNNISAGQVPQIPVSNVSDYKLISSIFRGSYNYDNRYYLTLSARYDGSSKFAEGKRFGFFPSVGASWRVLKEKWFVNNNFISEFKFRGSYGIIGNQALGPYNTLSTLSSTNAIFGGAINAGFSPSRIPNNELTWEQSKQSNIGFDFGILNNRISFSADIYQKLTDKLLYNVNLPTTSGFSTIVQNVAKLQNEGLELILEAKIIDNIDFKWSTSFNMAFNRNKVVSLQGNNGDFLGVNLLIGGAFLSRLTPGEAIGRFYGYQALPVWNDTSILRKPATFQPGAKEGDRRYKDQDGNGVLTDADRVYIGNSNPKFTGGFNSNFSYKNFDLAMFFSFSYGNQIFNQMRWSLDNLAGFNNALESTFLERYIPINAQTDPDKIDEIRQRNYTTKTAAAGASFDLREVTDYYIEDGSFLRCRDINIGYNLPPSILKKTRLGTARIYCNLQNLFTITNYSGFNPELNGTSLTTRGLDNGTYPNARTFRIGFNITL